MRVLIFNTDEKDTQNLTSMIKAFPINIIIDNASTYFDTMNYYKNNTYEKVFIDVQDEEGIKITKEILDIYPNQKLFMMGDDYNCTLEKNCNSCAKEHSKSLIIKPISQIELCKVMNNTFLCECKGKSMKQFNLEKIKKNIQKEFPYFDFEINQKEKIISSSPMPMQILVSFISQLEENNISYEVENFERINLK